MTAPVFSLALKIKKETVNRLSLFYVGVTYFSGPSPDKYLRRK